MTSHQGDHARSGTTKKAGKLSVKAPGSESLQQRAREQARECYQDILQRNGSVEDGIRAYHAIGKSLRNLVPLKHRNKYGKDLIGDFITEWTRVGGFKFGHGQAKYFRLFARAFDDKLLEDALDGNLSWTSLRELSGAEIDAAARRDLVRQAGSGELTASKGIAEVRSITGAGHKDRRNLRAKSARRMPAILSQQLASLARSLQRLDTALEHISAINHFSPRDVVAFCRGVIRAGELAQKCGLPWDLRMERAQKELDAARGKTGRQEVARPPA